MRKSATLILTALTISQANATPGQDSWGDANAKLHFLGEAAIAQAVTQATGDRTAGFAASFAIGLAREEWKRQHGFSHYTSNRLILDAAGAYLGSRCIVTTSAIQCVWAF